MLPDLHTGFSGGRSGVWYSHLLKNFPQFAVVLFVAYSLSQVYLTVNQIVGHHLAGRVFPGKEPICQMQETQEMWVQSLSQEDPLEEEMATHSNIFSWKTPWTEEPSGLQCMG